MKFDLITLFPEAFNFSYSIIGRAIEEKLIKTNIIDLREFGSGNRRNVDDKPFGGGPGMVMTIEPIYKALKSIGVYPKQDNKTKILLTSASGDIWTQSKAQESVEKLERIVIICGHYEGVDHRVAEYLADEEISIGNYVLSGGEIAAKVIVDSTSRLIEGVLGNPESLTEESFSLENQALEYPQYTRPTEFLTDEGEILKIPDILLSGHHAEIERWRKTNNKKL